MLNRLKAKNLTSFRSRFWMRISSGQRGISTGGIKSRNLWWEGRRLVTMMPRTGRKSGPPKPRLTPTEYRFLWGRIWNKFKGSWMTSLTPSYVHVCRWCDRMSAGVTWIKLCDEKSYCEFFAIKFFSYQEVMNENLERCFDALQYYFFARKII